MPGKLKILHLTTHLNVGGITNYLFILGSRMIREGHEVWVLSAGGDRAGRFADAGFRLETLPFRTKNFLDPRLLLLVPAAARLVRRECFDVIHAHTHVAQVLAALVSRRTGVPYVTTAHGFFTPRLGRRLFGCWGTRVIAISPLVGEDLNRRHRVAETRIRMVLNGIDIDGLRRRASEKNPGVIRREWGIPEGAIVLATVARLVADKGHRTLIEAAARLKSRYPGLYLLFVGDGREREGLGRLVRRRGLEGHVKLLPSEEDITKALSVTDIYVHPVTSREGFGLAVAEAMALKKPVIVTDVPALNRLIEDRVNGYVTAPGDPVPLADTIIRLIENPNEARAVAGRGAAHVAGRCSLERMVRETEAVYREAIAA